LKCKHISTWVIVNLCEISSETSFAYVENENMVKCVYVCLMLHTRAMYGIQITTHTFSVLFPTKNRRQRKYTLTVKIRYLLFNVF